VKECGGCLTIVIGTCERMSVINVKDGGLPVGDLVMERGKDIVAET
jgi:hypothetical protein